MESSGLQDFKTINTLIERDSKDMTYKYALLRGAVEISQEYCYFEGRLMPPFSSSRF